MTRMRCAYLCLWDLLLACLSLLESATPLLISALPPPIYFVLGDVNPSLTSVSHKGDLVFLVAVF
jgi:hypothetical protein